jgi:hypothetical protein
LTNLFDMPGEFIRGNLHTHTTNSDGKLSPQQTVDLYREHGYDFLAITDHNHLTATADLDTGGLVMLPGMELHQGQGELGQVHHIVGLGMQEQLQVPETPHLQAALEYIVPRCAVTFIAHPYWTSMTHLDLLGMGGHLGIEVFNYTCHCGIGRGDSRVHWDQLLARGERLLGFAVDDAHGHCCDYAGGWIMAKAPREPAGILSAIAAGHFYASSGPTIEDVKIGDGQVTVRCSPCQQVNVISPAAGCGATTHHLGPSGGPYTEVTLGLHESWDPFRVECIDERGRMAWTNPFWRN